MKKFLLISVIFLCLTQLSTAQVLINPKAGITTSRLSSDPEFTESTARLGWQTGVDFYFGETVYFMTGAHLRIISFELKTEEQIGDSDALIAEDELYWSELRIPAHVGFFILQTDLLTLRGGAGAAAMIHLGTRDNDFDIERSDFEPISFGAEANVGVSIWRITLDVGYQVGFTPVFEDVDNSNNNVFTVSLGLLLGEM